MITRRSLLFSTVAVTGCAVEGGAAPSAPVVASSGDSPRGAPATVPNIVTLRDASGQGARQHPVRLGRPFVPGELPGPPQALLDGVAVPTQALVETRWPDGSVQHAILFFVVPHIPAGGKVSVTFQAQPERADPGLAAAQMLAPEFDFDAAITISREAEARTASARRMLQDGKYTVWCQGPVATSIVLADHSVERRFDLGFDDLRSLRPIFHATFWPELRKVQLRAIGENINTETLQDMQYAVAITAGGATPQEVFRQQEVPHAMGTRWTRSFWIGEAPNAEIDIDHNLAYLGTTRTFPAYDTSLHLGESLIARQSTSWRARPRNLYDSAGWTKYMPNPGGRDDIGPHTGWTTRWLYTGDHRMLEIVAGLADLAGAWPLHAREGSPAKRFDAARTVPGLGRVISGAARPTLWLFDPRDASSPEDKVTYHGAPLFKHANGWYPDAAHQPDPYSALYALTGDYFYLEQLQLWAGTQVVCFAPPYKGPPGSGVIVSETRGHAWAFRNRVHAAFLTPDGAPEKAYFHRLTDDAIAHWEGWHGIAGTRFEKSPCWEFGRKSLLAHPLHFFKESSLEDGRTRGLRQGIKFGQSLWEQYYLIVELARAKDKGFPAGPMLTWAGETLTGQFRQESTYDPTNTARYWTGTRNEKGEFFKTWTEVLDGYIEPAPPAKYMTDPDVCDGAMSDAYAASTVLVNEPGGREAYTWLRQNFYDKHSSKYSACPKRAFLPRP